MALRVQWLTIMECNRLEPDFVMGGRNWDMATVDRGAGSREPGAKDVWSASTDKVIVQGHAKADYCN
jgi:hypothetical protein